MWRLLLIFWLIGGICYGDYFNGPTNLSLKFFNDLSIQGPAKLRMIKAKSLEVKGPLEFNRLDVKGKADVIGEFKGEKGKFGQLTVTGSVNAEYVKCETLVIKGAVSISYLEVAQKADIEGSLTGTHCQIKQLNVQADQIVLEEVKIEKILVKNGSSITLKGDSTIKGDIVFELGHGIVHVEGDKVKILGEIKGGEVSLS